MKKFSLLACMMTVVTSVAIGQQTVTIPFYADDPGNNQSAFVGLQNSSTGSIVVTVVYKDGLSNATTSGTFTLGAQESVAYQPYQTTGAEIQLGVPSSPYAFGSLTFNTDGGSVAGRYVQFNEGGAFNGAFAHNVEVGP